MSIERVGNLAVQLSGLGQELRGQLISVVAAQNHLQTVVANIRNVDHIARTRRVLYSKHPLFYIRRGPNVVHDVDRLTHVG